MARCAQQWAQGKNGGWHAKGRLGTVSALAAIRAYPFPERLSRLSDVAQVNEHGIETFRARDATLKAYKTTSAGTP